MAQRAPHQLTPDVKLLNKVVLVHAGSVLLLKRDGNSATRPLQWDLPGGNSEWPTAEDEIILGLHREDTAREVREETGITVLPDHFTLDTMVFFETRFQNKVFSIITGWVVELPSDFDRDSVVISHEHIEYEWVAFDTAREYDFGYGKTFLVPMIRTAQARFAE